MVHVDPDDPGAADRIQCAGYLAADHQAKLVGSAAGVTDPALEVRAAGTAAFAIGVMPGNSTAIEQRFAAARSLFTRWTSGLTVATQWRTAIDFPAAALADMAGAADLIVVGSPGGSLPRSRFDSLSCGDLVMRAGRPILAIPTGISKLGRSRAVVAWKNTREARRALGDALPLLGAADGVTVLHVREHGAGADASLADAKAFLEAHSVEADALSVEGKKGNMAAQIVEFARRSQSNLIVAGAYGHSRLREWAFGGVTRYLLAECPFACLLSR